MVFEKQAAVRDAGLAVAGDLARLQRDVGRQWAGFFRVSSDLSDAAAGVGAMMARQVAIAGSLAGTADKAVRPFHGRARANARRLGTGGPPVKTTRAKRGTSPAGSRR